MSTSTDRAPRASRSGLDSECSGRFVLALDQGTTSSRALLFDAGLRPVAMAQQAITQHYPHPGWVEHDPEEIWRTQLDCARRVLAEAGVPARAVAAIGIANQRETTLIWDRASGAPIAPAIVWQDRRTAPWCDAQRAAGLADRVHAHTGLVLDPYFSASKIVWLLEHVPGARARAQRGELAFGTVDSWLVYRLTGARVHATDVTNASRTMLLDLRGARWDEALLEAWDIPRALLPQLVPSSGIVAETDPALFGAPIPVAGIAGDQQAALFGHACVEAGQGKNTYGTGCFMLVHTGAERQSSSAGLVTTAAAQVGARRGYALEGGVFVAGAVVQWLRDELGMIDSAEAIEPLAASVPDTDGIFVVPAFAGLGSPYWDASARGAIVGLTRGSTRAHLARAALESIALQSAELLHTMQGDAGLEIDALRVDGGATRNDLLMQMQADLIGVPVVRPRVVETTAQGAANLAALAVGVCPDEATLAAMARDPAAIERVFEPARSADWREARMAQWRRAVARSLQWVE